MKIAKITSLILVVAVCLTFGVMVGYNFKSKNAEKSDFDILYSSFDKLSINDKLAIFNSKLDAKYGPSEVRYLLDKIIDDLPPETKDNAVALYINHLQYFMGTYSDFLEVYGTIILNSRNEVDFTNIHAADQISDRILQTIIKEIYDNDMIIQMPRVGLETPPYALIDYNALTNRYDKYISDVTKEYIGFKKQALNNELAMPDGSVNMDLIEEFIGNTSNFISMNPSFALIDDVIYSYIVSAQMYMGIYNVSGEFTVDKDLLERYKQFIVKYPDTPITGALNEMIEVSEKGEAVSSEMINSYQDGLASLLQGN